MLFNKTSFIGIDPTAGRIPFVYAVLDSDLRLLALGKGNIDEVMAYVGGQEQAFVSVNAPRQPNQGLMTQEHIRNELNPKPRPGRWLGYRVAEYELRMRRITMPRTPREGEKTPGWMSMGYAVFERLEKMGYAPYPAGDLECQSLEVYPHAAYAVLLGRLPFPKRTFSGRIQRQLVLYGCEVDVPDPMRVFEEFTRYRLLQGVLPLDGLHSDRELDALVAAYISWLSATNPRGVQLVGREDEGQVVLPDSQMRARY